MRLKIKGNRLLQEMLGTDKRFISHVGGSRSGKTYSILQYILIYAFKNQGKTITIARKTFPSLRLGAMREFIQLLKDYQIYKEEHHNKTNHIYNLNGNTIQFISIDQSIKLRGLKHDIIFIDEVNEITKEEADQLFLRTTERIIMAQNPSDALHWSVTYQTHGDCLYIHSTYKDNAFLEKAIINQILSYKETDEDMWNVYGLGLPAKNNELVYNHYKFFLEEDLSVTDETGKKWEIYSDIIWGLDFGFNHPTALVKIWINDNTRTIWAKEMIHESYLTTEDLIAKMKSLNIGDETIYCDSAEPKTIESIRRAGWNAVSSMKEVKEGIDCIKSCHFFIHKDSTKLQDELRKYKWKFKNEMKTDEPIKLFDDGLCAIRYATFTYLMKHSRARAYDFDIEIIDL